MSYKGFRKALTPVGGAAVLRRAGRTHGGYGGERRAGGQAGPALHVEHGHRSALGRTAHAGNKTAGWRNLACLRLTCLYPGSGKNIPAIWRGAGAYPDVFIPATQY